MARNRSMRPTLSFLAAGLAAAVALGSPAEASRPYPGCAAKEPTSVVPKADAAGAAQAVQRLNEFRRVNGLGPVVVDPRLMLAAQQAANRMAAADKLDHYLDGRPIDRTMAAGFCFPAAENISRGHMTIMQAMVGWEQSPAHRDNLLRPNANTIGVAVVMSPRSRQYYWAILIGDAPQAVYTALAQTR